MAVVQDDEVVLEKGFGFRTNERGSPVTVQTLFPIGSTTKAFTSTVAGTFVDEGVLEWDRPVQEYVSSFRLRDPDAARYITLRDMLSHRTGLAPHDMLMFMYGGGELSRAELVDRLAHLPFSQDLREGFQYNNLIYTAAAYICEVVTGLTWEEAVTERLLEPLGMENTNFSINELQKSDDHSRPHSSRDGSVVEIPFRPIETVGPAGSINSCIADMSRWLRMNLDDGRYGDRQIVSADALREMREAAIALPSEMPWPEIEIVGYGLGWVVEDYRGQRVVWHNGGIDGFKAIVSLIASRRLGVAVLANRFPSEAPEAIAYRVFDELLGLDPIDWGERRLELETAGAAELEKERAERAAKAKDARPTHPLEEFAGRYEHPGYGGIVIEVVDGELTADLHGLEVTMHHRHYNVWDAHEIAHGIVIPFVFQIDAEGEIGRVEAALEPAVDPIVFRRVTVES